MWTETFKVLLVKPPTLIPVICDMFFKKATKNNLLTDEKGATHIVIPCGSKISLFSLILYGILTYSNCYLSLLLTNRFTRYYMHEKTSTFGKSINYVEVSFWRPISNAKLFVLGVS